MKLPRMILCALLSLSILLTAALPALADEPDGPSGWAAEGVSEAVELGMVPERLQSDWQQDLTRGDFAQLAVQFLAAQYGYGNKLGSGFSLEDFFEDYPSLRPAPDGTPFSKADYLTPEENTPDSFYSWKGILSDRVNVFEDVEPGGLAAYINLAYLLGVVKGRDESHYDPDGVITRQEAAALLGRTYGVYGTLEPKEGGAEPFTDAAAIAPWAAEDVAAMASWDILHGDESRAFSPLAHYTREQGVLAFLRLYKNMPVSRYNGALTPLLSQEDVVERCMSGGPYPRVLFQGETELCTVLCMAYGGVMRPPEPAVFLIYPDSTYKRVEVSGTPQDFQLTDHTLTFATGYDGQRVSLDLATGTLTAGPISETDQPLDPVYTPERFVEAAELATLGLTATVPGESGKGDLKYNDGSGTTGEAMFVFEAKTSCVSFQVAWPAAQSDDAYHYQLYRVNGAGQPNAKVDQARSSSFGAVNSYVNLLVGTYYYMVVSSRDVPTVGAGVDWEYDYLAVEPVAAPVA